MGRKRNEAIDGVGGDAMMGYNDIPLPDAKVKHPGRVCAGMSEMNSALFEIGSVNHYEMLAHQTRRVIAAEVAEKVTLRVERDLGVFRVRGEVFVCYPEELDRWEVETRHLANREAERLRGIKRDLEDGLQTVKEHVSNLDREIIRLKTRRLTWRERLTGRIIEGR